MGVSPTNQPYKNRITKYQLHIPWCNLFYRQVCHTPPTPVQVVPPSLICSIKSQILTQSQNLLTGLSADQSSAPVGVNPECGILKAGSGGSLGNIANIIVCALSMFFVAGLVVFSSRRKAAVGESFSFSFLFVFCFGSLRECPQFGLFVLWFLCALAGCNFCCF